MELVGSKGWAVVFDRGREGVMGLVDFVTDGELIKFVCMFDKIIDKTIMAEVLNVVSVSPEEKAWD